MSANQTIKCDLLGAQFSEFEGNKYVKLFIGQPVGNPIEEKAKGVQVLSLSAQPEVFDKLDSNTAHYPMPVDIEVRLQRGAQNKMSQIAIAVYPVKPQAQTKAS